LAGCSSEYPREYVEYFRLFEEKDYYGCHEVLESLWLGDRNDFYKGLIQFAVALYHLNCGNVEGARKLFRRSSEYLNMFEPRYCGLDVSRVTAYSRECLALLPPERRIPVEHIPSLGIPEFKMELEPQQN
jgi:uncharacterized protein